MTERPYHRKNLAATIQQRARQQLEEVGAEQLSLRQIARFLAVTPAAVYRHYPNKASLLAVLRSEISGELTMALRANVLDSADAQEMLKQMVLNLLTYNAQHPRAVAYVLTAPLPVPASLTTVLTLYAAQQGAPRTSGQNDLAVWTLLLGALVQGTDVTLNQDWLVAQIEKLMK